MTITRKLTTLLAFLLAAGAASAQVPPPPPQEPPSRTAPQAATTKEIAVQVISTDPEAKTITVKKQEASGAPEATSTTFPVEAAALDDLEDVRAGEKVKLVCKTDTGGKETVTAIKKEEPKSTRPPY